MRQNGRRKGSETNMQDETKDTAATVAAQSAHVVPEKDAAKRSAASRKGGPKGQKPAKAVKTKAARQKPAKTGKKATRKQPAKRRAESKGAKILALIGRPKGATLAEIQKVSGWQAHSVRGFLSTAAKRYSLRIESTKSEGNDRVYHIK